MNFPRILHKSVHFNFIIFHLRMSAQWFLRSVLVLTEYMQVTAPALVSECSFNCSHVFNQVHSLLIIFFNYCGLLSLKSSTFKINYGIRTLCLTCVRIYLADDRKTNSFSRHTGQSTTQARHNIYGNKIIVSCCLIRLHYPILIRKL